MKNISNIINSIRDTEASPDCVTRTRSISDVRYHNELSGLNFKVSLDDINDIFHFRTDLHSQDFHESTLIAHGTNSDISRTKLNDDDVVLKTLKKQVTLTPIALKEFTSELSILSKVNHPNIVKFFGSGIEPRQFLVIEYIKSGTLADKFNQSRSRPPMVLCEALGYARQLADALNYLHMECVPDASIIHRDLKPDNVGLSDGVIKLFDFGLSICVKRRTAYNEAYEMTGCTGTMRYMAPEVALRKPYSEKVDVYSFGILFWQMASSGSVPFHLYNRADFMQDVVIEGYRPLMCTDWPQELETLLAACWHADSQSRPSFLAVLQSIDSIMLCKTITKKGKG